MLPGAAAKNWPNSDYGDYLNGNSNNSNTFIHEMAKAIGRSVPLTGWGGRSHPGNIEPQHVIDTKMGDIPIYTGKAHPDGF